MAYQYEVGDIVIMVSRKLVEKNTKNLRKNNAENT